jgi:hypothetical protein
MKIEENTMIRIIRALNEEVSRREGPAETEEKAGKLLRSNRGLKRYVRYNI